MAVTVTILEIRPVFNENGTAYAQHAELELSDGSTTRSWRHGSLPVDATPEQIQIMLDAEAEDLWREATQANAPVISIFETISNQTLIRALSAEIVQTDNEARKKAGLKPRTVAEFERDLKKRVLDLKAKGWK